MGNFLFFDGTYWMYTWLLGNGAIIFFNWFFMRCAALFNTAFGGVRYFIGTLVVYIAIGIALFDNFFLFSIPEDFDQETAEEQAEAQEKDKLKEASSSTVKPTKTKPSSTESSTKKKSTSPPEKAKPAKRSSPSTRKPAPKKKATPKKKTGKKKKRQ